MRSAFLVVGAAWFAMMAAVNLATPLYAIYQRAFAFSSAVLTLVFATYALVLAPSLLVFGQLSDRLGRRRVMAAGFATGRSACWPSHSRAGSRGCSRLGQSKASPSA